MINLTVVSHHGQEQSNLAFIDYKGPPTYIQRQTEKMLRPFQELAKAYVDDTKNCSQTLSEHREHLKSERYLYFV